MRGMADLFARFNVSNHTNNTKSIFLVFFVNSLQQQITNNLYAYVISSFSAHSLMPVATIVSGLLAGVLKLPTAQLMNIWGRPLGLVAVTGMMAIGLAVMAGCQNVETYVAGQVSFSTFLRISYLPINHHSQKPVLLLGRL
jgi:hypothetical protein